MEGSRPGCSGSGDGPLSVAALEEKVDQLLEGEIDSELVTTGNSTSRASIWYDGYYQPHRRPSLHGQLDLKRRESDKERQFPWLKKWPRFLV